MDTSTAVKKGRKTAPPTLVLSKIKGGTASDACWFPDRAIMDALTGETPSIPSSRPPAPTPKAFRDSQDTVRTLRPHQAGQGRACFWCFRPLAPGSGMGLPLSNGASEGTFCGHNQGACAYAWWLREMEKPVRLRAALLTSSASLLMKHLGLAALTPAADYRLLCHNGGELSEEAFDHATSSAFYDPHSRCTPMGRVNVALTPSVGTTFVNQSIIYPYRGYAFPELKPIEEA